MVSVPRTNTYNLYQARMSDCSTCKHREVCFPTGRSNEGSKTVTKICDGCLRTFEIDCARLEWLRVHPPAPDTLVVWLCEDCLRPEPDPLVR